MTDALYPFLTSAGSGAESLSATVARSTAEKAREIVALRREVLTLLGPNMAACVEALVEAFAAGGRLFVFGNGGSSTDAQDIVHTFLDPGPGAVPLPALALTADAAVVTALSNDIGFEVVFARQLRAGGGPGDVAVGVSTSGGSANVLAGLAEARRMGMVTVGLAGYGGGAMAESEEVGELDHLFAMPSSSVHRVQEVQTTLYHVLWETVQAALSLRRPPDPGPRTPPPGRD